MTIDISANNPRISYSVAAGVTQTSFTVPFEFFDDSDLNVYIDTTLQTITTNYTVTGGAGSTGTVTMSVTGPKTVILTRDTTIERTTDFTAGVDINRAALNTQLDTLTAISADNKDLGERSIRINDYDPAAANLLLPDAITRADKLLSFDTEGDVSVQSAADLITGSILGANYTKASHTGNGTETAYSTIESAGSKNNIQVYVDGVYQNKDTFSVDGSTLTFSEAPPLNSAIEFIVGNAIRSFGGMSTQDAEDVAITGGTIDGTTIGGSTPAAVTGTTITGTSFASTGDMTFGDNDKAVFGSGSDLQISHDGSHSYITDNGTGNLYAQADNYLVIRKSDESKISAWFNTDAEVQLRYNDSLKLATTSTGVDITGNLKFINAGNGIDFSATSGTGTSELFSDYEEGTWTPTLTTDGTDFDSVTYDALTSGYYTKVGDLVVARGRLRTDAVTVGSASGNVLIGGLPFTVGGSATGRAPVLIGEAEDFSTNNPSGGRTVESSVTARLFYRSSANGAATSLPVSSIDTGANKNQASFTIIYRV